MKDIDKLFSVDNHYTRTLDIDKDLDRVQKLCEECEDYSILVEGRKPLLSAGKELFTDLPPGKSLEDKSILGLFNNENELLGVIEILRNYPEEKTWFIGLMMFKPGVRGKGIGKNLYEALIIWLSDKDVMRIKIGVVKENKRAFNFWGNVGFKEINKIDNYEIGNRVTSVYVMEHKLI